MRVDLTPYISSIVTAVIAIVGGYVAMKNSNNQKFDELKSQNAELMAQNAAQTAEIRALKEQVEKHNGVLERVYKLESDMRTAFKRIDELKAEDKRLDEKIERR